MDCPTSLIFLQQPITDEAELAALRSQGLTTKGESKVTKGDLRCRPPRAYSETFFDKKLPQFRLRTVIETARAEDVVMAWAFVTKRGKCISLICAPRTSLKYTIPGQK